MVPIQYSMEGVMAKTTSSSSSSTTTSGSQGGINVGEDLQGGILGQIFENFANQGGASGGVAQITPEMQAAINAMMGAQGGSDLLGGGTGALQQGTGILGGNVSVDPNKVQETAAGLVNKDFLGNQLGQLTEEANKGLTQGLNQISSGASMSGGLGSSRSALAQGQAVEGSQKALANAQSNLVNSTYQQAMQQALGIEQGNISNQLQQGQLLGQLGLGQAGLGAQMNNDQINAMLKAGVITQEQAQKMQESGGKNINQLLGQLGALFGSTNQSQSDTTTSGSQNSGMSGGDVAGGILGSITGSIGDWLLKD